MSKNIFFALSLLLSAVANAMNTDDLPTFTSTPTASSPVSAQRATTNLLESSAVVGTESPDVGSSKRFVDSLAAPFVWIANTAKKGAIATKDGAITSARAIKSMPGNYIELCKNEKFKAAGITAGALIVAGGVSYVAYNYYQQKKANKERMNHLLADRA